VHAGFRHAFEWLENFDNETQAGAKIWRLAIDSWGAGWEEMLAMTILTTTSSFGKCDFVSLEILEAADHQRTTSLTVSSRSGVGTG